MDCAFPGDEGERESKIDQGTWSMCSGSSIKSFVSWDLQFQHKPGISWVGIDAVTYRMDMKRSWNVPLTIWFDSGSIGNLKIIPILAGLMIALTSLFHANSNKTNNIQSDHQHSLSSVGAAENYHPINFFLRCSNPGLGSPLVNETPNCSVVEILSNLIPHFTISSQNQIIFVW